VNALRRAHAIAQQVSVFGVALRSLNERTTRLYDRYGFAIRQDGVSPLMVLPIWTLNDLFAPKVAPASRGAQREAATSAATASRDAE